MRIDVVHLRDPDYECDVEVYLDGQRVEHQEWSFDPGRGYEMADFEQMRQGAIDAAPDFLKPRIRELYDQMKPTYERWSL